MRVQILEVKGVFHIHGLRARHDIGKAVTRHHQVVRLVHKLSVVLLQTMHIGGSVCRGHGCRPLEWILLLEAVTCRLLLRAALAVRGRRLHLHLEVWLSVTRVQVVVLNLMRSHDLLGLVAFQAAIALLASGRGIDAVA